MLNLVTTLRLLIGLVCLLAAGPAGAVVPRKVPVVAEIVTARGQEEVRFVDENSRHATDADFQWAEAVLTSGMHIQRQHIHEIVRRTLMDALGKGGVPELEKTRSIKTSQLRFLH